MKAILIVDDDAAIREAISEILREEGYAVLVACDGSEALDVLRQTPALPGVVLLDALMPKMSGRSFLEVARQAYPDLPVIVMSAHVRGLALADGFVAKPMRLEDLLGIAREFCEELSPNVPDA
jgi:CheY-like chemotaxis protein